MVDKEKTLLIRISQELSDEISSWAKKVDQNKSVFVRNSIRSYIDNLSNENPEVLELIKGIIITKIDKIQSSYNEGRLIAFTRIVRVSSTLSCNLCRDEEDAEYVVYTIFQKEGESMLEAIHRYAHKLYRIWQALPLIEQKRFLVDLQMNHVYFSIQIETDER